MTELGTASHERTMTAAGPGGRPRDPEISQAILDATLEVLREDGYARLTMADVALRAGVHKPAIYRRWANKLDLAVDAIGLLAPEMPDPATGDVRTDLVEVLLVGAGRAQDRNRVATMLRLQAELAAEPALAAAVQQRIVAPWRAALSGVLERAVRKRQLRSNVDLDLAIDMLFAPLGRLATQGTGLRISRREATAIVDQLFFGLVPATKRGRA